MEIKAHAVSDDAVSFEAKGFKHIESTDSYICLVFSSEDKVSEELLDKCDETMERPSVGFLVTFEGVHEFNVDK